MTTGPLRPPVRQDVSSQWDMMQFTPLGRMLCVLSPACLQLSPDTSQFFMYDRVSLNCEDPTNSSSWTVRRRTSEGGVRPCSSGWGSTSSESTCSIGNLYPSDSGLYWCESAGGEGSSSVNITVTDGLHIGSSSSGEMSISSVSRSDEGLYKCSISGGDESLSSWVTVHASCPPSSSCPPAAVNPPSAFRLMCHLLVGTPYLLATILLAIIHRDRKRAARTLAERRSSNDVIMETPA